MRARASRGLRLSPVALLAAASALAAGCADDAGGARTYSREKLMDPETCKECHQDHYTQWSGSMHAYAAEDPVFRAMNQKGQDETGGALKGFCVKCHAPLAVQEGLTEDGTNLDEVPKAYQGITCYFCHQVEDVEDTHNNPLVLANDTTMRAAISGAVKNVAHETRYSELHDGNSLESAKLCGSCHDIVVPAHLTGASADVALERTYTEWQGSVFAKGGRRQSPQSCNLCHMKRTTGAIGDDPHVDIMPDRTVHNHMFPGVDVAITDFPQKQAQLGEVLAFLGGNLGMKLCPQLGDTGQGEITLDNVFVGHNMPSGASQDRRMWIEVKGYEKGDDDTETLVASQGVVPDGADPTAVTDPVLLLRDEVFDKDGAPTHAFWKAASVKEGTIKATVTVNPLEPGAGQEHAYASYDLAGLPTRIEAHVRIQPIGRDVLQELADGGYLDRAFVDAVPTHEIRSSAGDPASLVWTFADQGCVTNQDQ